MLSPCQDTNRVHLAQNFTHCVHRNLQMVFLAEYCGHVSVSSKPTWNVQMILHHKYTLHSRAAKHTVTLCKYNCRIIQSHLPPDKSEHIIPNHSQMDWYSIYLAQMDGRLSWSTWLVTYGNGSSQKEHCKVLWWMHACNIGCMRGSFRLIWIHCQQKSPSPIPQNANDLVCVQQWMKSIQSLIVS